MLVHYIQQRLRKRQRWWELKATGEWLAYGSLVTTVQQLTSEPVFASFPRHPSCDQRMDWSKEKIERDEGIMEIFGWLLPWRCVLHWINQPFCRRYVESLPEHHDIAGYYQQSISHSERLTWLAWGYSTHWIRPKLLVEEHANPDLWGDVCNTICGEWQNIINASDVLLIIYVKPSSDAQPLWDSVKNIQKEITTWVDGYSSLNQILREQDLLRQNIVSILKPF